MPTNAGRDVLGLLRQLARGEGEVPTDGVLLTAFVQHRQEAALTALVHRHSGMVWSVCRRLLGDGQDAEDAFQATFLVLVRKAANLRAPEKVASWLYGVARQTAVRMRALRARQGNREKQVAVMPEPAKQEPEDASDLASILDEELSRLPDKYRTVLILCDLEERPRSEVARQLGCPEGTVAGRLARARALLAGRLTRRGVTTPAGSLAPALAPPALVSSTVQAALTGAASATVALLTQGVLNAMFLNRLKIGLVVLLVLVLGTGGGVLLSSAGQPQQQNQQPEKQLVPVADNKLPPRPIPPEIAKAWVQVGGPGWMRVNEHGTLTFTDQHETGRPGEVPAFHMLWAQGYLPGLPDPGVPFGLKLRGIPDAGLKEVARFTSLQGLDLSRTQVICSGLKELAVLKNVHWLDLSYTLARDFEMEEVARFTNLRALNLTGGELTDKGLKLLAGLKNMQALQLNSTRVTDAGVKELAGLIQLEVLDWGGTQVGDVGLQALIRMTRMRVLSLTNTPVTDEGMKSLAGLTNMQILDLSVTRVTDLGLKELAGLTSLRHLKLGGTKVADRGLKELAGMKDLQSLELWSTPVSDLGLKELAGFKELQFLSLRSTRISDAGLKELVVLRNLKTLDLGSRTRVTIEGAAALQKALPGCQIVGLSED
jgi:RNA polymerase sigma factor (sigma-70 family)